MLIRLLLLLLLGLLLGALGRLLWLRLSPRGRRNLGLGLFTAVVLILVGAALVGRLSWLVPAMTAALPMLRRLPLLFRLGRAAQAFRPMGALSLRPILLMEGPRLLDGEVLAGPDRSKTLSQLEPEALAKLWRTLHRDPLAGRLLPLYLAERFGKQWFESPPFPPAPAPGAALGPLRTVDALALLGLSEGADAAAIRHAHRRLMHRAHPDHGGSDALAALLNAAKDQLLGA
jgi:hypothetical protein